MKNPGGSVPSAFASWPTCPAWIQGLAQVRDGIRPALDGTATQATVLATRPWWSRRRQAETRSRPSK